MRKDIEIKYGNKLRVRVCGICIQDNALLLIHHEGIGSHNNLWIPPGGGVNHGENTKEALKREFKEETGLSVEVGDLLFVNEHLQYPVHAIELFFHIPEWTGRLRKGFDPEMTLPDQIIKEVKFVSFEEIRIMEQNILHNVLHDVDDPEVLLNMRGYFKF